RSFTVYVAFVRFIFFPCFFFFFFFFSSRRRHTRFSRDWSSDVCSSDLGPISVPELPALALSLDRLWPSDGQNVVHRAPLSLDPLHQPLVHRVLRPSRDRRAGENPTQPTSNPPHSVPSMISRAREIARSSQMTTTTTSTTTNAVIRTP